MDLRNLGAARCFPPMMMAEKGTGVGGGATGRNGILEEGPEEGWDQ